MSDLDPIRSFQGQAYVQAARLKFRAIMWILGAAIVIGISAAGFLVYAPCAHFGLPLL